MTSIPAPAEDLAAEAWRRITSLFLARKQSFPQIAASFGLNPGAMNALLFLDPTEPKPMGALAEAWRCDASNVTWLVDRLEERGLARRVPHLTDRRVRTVALTTKGVRLRAEVEAKVFETPEELQALSRRDLDTLCRILRRVAPEHSS